MIKVHIHVLPLNVSFIILEYTLVRSSSNVTGGRVVWWIDKAVGVLCH